MGSSMIIRRVSQVGGGGTGAGYQPVLIERDVVVIIDKGKESYIPIDVDCLVYDIRTIKITNNENIDQSCYISDNTTNGDILYKSLKEKYTYDILNIPCQDKSGTQCIHFYLKNEGGVTATFTVRIKIIKIS